jgi:hypothetical protein
LVVLLHGTEGSAANHFAFLAPMLAASRRVSTVDSSIPPTAS